MTGTPATTKNGPTGQANTDLTQILKQAQGLYNSSSGYKTPPLAALYRPFSAQTQAGLGGMNAYAGQGDPLAGQSQAGVSSILGGNTANEYQGLLANSGNQAFEGALDTQAGHLTDDINREFSGLGRTGSAAQSGTIAQQVGDMRNQAEANQWNQNIANQRGILGDQTNAQLSAISAAPGAWEQGLLPSQIQTQVGSAYDQQNQNLAAAQLQRFNARTGAPWNRLAEYGTVTSNPSGAFSQQQQVAPTNPLGGLLGGGLLGYQAGTANGGQNGGLGAAIGGGLGFLSNMFGL